jgi:hypothetical protein
MKSVERINVYQSFKKEELKEALKDKVIKNEDQEVININESLDDSESMNENENEEFIISSSRFLKTSLDLNRHKRD